MLFAMSSCNEIENTITPGAEGEGELQEMTIQVSIPSHANNQFRSIGPDEEKAVKSMDVLAFRIGNDGKEYFDYLAKSSISGTAGASTQSIKVVAWTRGYQQRFVILTNAHESVTALLNSKESTGGWKDTEKDAMLALFEFALGTNNQWTAVSSSNYIAFPMWGESDAAIITKQTQQLPNTVVLLRMTAKINVQLDENKEWSSLFKLASVRLFNTNTRGNIVPATDNIRKTTIGGKTQIDALRATVPADAQRSLGPLYYGDITSGTDGLAINESIYLFETNAANKSESSNATCLVIGGFFGGSKDTTYYRVDFLDKETSSNFQDILRNHQYTVNILDVKEKGYDTWHEAFEAKSMNMVVEISDWTEDNTHITFDGQYYFSVNKNFFDFSREACTTDHGHNILVVNTNYATAAKRGWIIKNITDEDGSPVTWLTVTAPNGTKNVGAYSESLKEDSLVLTFSENGTGKPRYANIIFAAGRLHHTVQVVQDIREGVSIVFYDGSGKIVEDNQLIPDGPKIDTLKFYYPSSIMVNQVAFPFTITWTPKEAEVRVFETHKYMEPINGVTNYLNFNTNPPRLRVITSHTGIFVYHIGLDFKHTPEDRQEMSNAQSAVGFYLSNGVEEIERHIVFVCYPF
ncbi:hypothetical protein FACS189474_4190 [Bacteroidia bacterium]|nr:hypothetical protein FACS189474_4190 [Bacteroidia bacterium]